MGAGLTSANRYRHVVFTTGFPVGRPLDLGAGRAARVSPAPIEPPLIERQMDEATFLGWLFRQVGLSLHDYRPAPLMRRLPACLRVLRCTSISQARRTLLSNPDLFPIALDALLLGVTEFFRDAHVFARLREELRGIAARNSGLLRIWSAGCSTGAELYSVAVVLGELGSLARSELLGTDIRPGAIALAREGPFSSSKTHTGITDAGGWISWRCGNVLRHVERGPWDVVLCRNLAMYLHGSAAERLWRGLAAEIRPGGLLVVGKAERPSDSAGLVNVGSCLYRRVES